MLILPGSPALSAFRLDKLAPRLSAIHPQVRLLTTEYIHFADLDGDLPDDRLAVLENLLAYGPDGGSRSHGADRSEAALMLVVPRPGTISPWSSKATDIAHNCGLTEVHRLERGIAYYLAMPEDISADQRNAVAGLLHDRMTEAVLNSSEDAGQLFVHAEPAAMTQVDILGGGREALVAADADLGLALADDEIDYLVASFR